MNKYKYGEKMLKKILPILLALTILLTACGSQGTPTMAPADVQNTAVAAAWTVVAMTQAAIPTATPLPPTETPMPTLLPTFTAEPLIIPTLEPLLPPPANTVPPDPSNCNKPLNVAEAGPTNPMRIENNSGGPINLSLNLATNAFGQCGALSYSVPKNGKQVINIPKGSWWAYAWITYPNGTSGTSEGSFLINPGDFDMLRIIVGKESIQSKP
jgi:hypothetical protein